MKAQSSKATIKSQQAADDPAKNEPSILLFDLGGVLIRWEGVETLAELAEGRLETEEARRFWLESEWVRSFERGLCNKDEFAVGVVESLRLRQSPKEFIELFLSWDKGPYPGAEALLMELSRRFPLCCLSNNNELHWPRLRDQMGFGRFFNRAYLSYELGMVKPDLEIFEFVVSDLECDPAQILFFDDNPECVEAARVVGMQACRSVGVEAVRRALQLHALI